MAEILVKSPVTTDGITLAYDETTNKPMYREMVLPVAAKPLIEKQNEKLPPHLKKIISLVPEPNSAPKPSGKPEKLIP